VENASFWLDFGSLVNGNRHGRNGGSNERTGSSRARRVSHIFVVGGGCSAADENRLGDKCAEFTFYDAVTSKKLKTVLGKDLEDWDTRYRVLAILIGIGSEGIEYQGCSLYVVTQLG
jgi:hypothetical protein